MVGASVGEFSIVLPEGLDAALRAKFLGYGGQEDGGFGLWAPVIGATRTTAIMQEWVWPLRGEVEHHGNITLSSNYYSRVRERARELGFGIIIGHSHPGARGWSSPSSIDIQNERAHLARGILDLTGLPLVGMILSGAGDWSGRFYHEGARGKITRTECVSVRSVGRFLTVHFNPNLRPPPPPALQQTRTRNVWGALRHSNLTRLRVGVAGFGSVGSLVAEQLARMGVEELVIAEFDRVEAHNLDRLVHATRGDAGRRLKKIQLARRELPKSATAGGFRLGLIDGSVVEADTFVKLLDCDVVFSCVDMNWPRQVLNHMSYTCAIPVVDGGVSIRLRSNGDLQHGVVRSQTIGPGRTCLNCLGMYDAGRIQMERDGSLLDPLYIEQLGERERQALEAARQNVIPFATLLSGLEVLQFIELATGMAQQGDMGRQQYDYSSGELIPDRTPCHQDCEYVRMTCLGSRLPPVLGSDPQRRDIQKLRKRP